MKVLNFGSCNVDYVYKVDHIIKAGETLAAEGIEIFPGGKGLNQSIAIAKAGTAVTHAGVIGKDGEFLVDIMKEAGVNTSLVNRESCQSGHAIIQVDKKGENCICVFEGANGRISREYIDEVLSNFGEGDMMLLQNEIPLIPYILDSAYKKRIKVIFNPSPFNERIKEVDLGKISYLILNETEAEAITGSSDKDAFVSFMREHYPSLGVVLTLGKRGAVYFSRTEYVKQSAYSVKAVDTTSAGDTFTGYFVSFISKNKSIAEALRYAAVASAITVSRLGASVSIPYISEVMKLEGELKPYTPERKSAEKDIISRIKAYVSESADTASLRDLASRLGYSTAYTGALVKKHLGVSFTQLVRTERCRLAAKMLSDGMSVEEAIKRAGYENESFFRKKFKAIYGLLPKEYKKERRK